MLMPKCKYIFVTICFVLFTVSLERITHISYNSHILKSSFGLAEGLGMFCFTFNYYIRMLREEKNKWVLLLMTGLMLFATTGLKGPVAAIMLVGIATGSVIMMFKNHEFLYGALSGLTLLVFFLVPLVLFVINLHSEAAEGSHAVISLSATDTIFHSHYFENIYDKMINAGVWKPLTYIIVVIMYLISTLLIPLILLVITFKRKVVNDIDIIAIVMIVVGCVLGMFVSQEGMSQMYFFFVSITLIFLLDFSWIQDRALEKNRYKALIIVFVIGLALWGIYYKNVFISNTVNLVKSTKIGNDYLEKIHQSKEGEDSGLTITKQEIEALRWCRANLPEDAIILSNKVLSSNMGSRSFWVSCITEHQTFFEAYDYSNVPKEIIDANCYLIDSFYNGYEQVLDSLKQKGVTHAVVFKGIIPNSYPIRCKMLYENNKIIVVEI